MATQPGGPMPPLPSGVQLPFYYASLTDFILFYEVEPAVLEPFLKGTGLQPATFTRKGGKPMGAVMADLQTYTTQGGNYLDASTSVEFNILSYPGDPSGVPQLTLQQFVMGEDQTKLIGGFRVYVPNTSKLAVEAGRKNFGEPKFVTTFDFALPCPNLPNQPAWTYTVNDPGFKPNPKTHAPDPNFIYKVAAKLPATEPLACNPGEVVFYCMLPGGKIVGDKGYTGRLSGSRWAIYGAHQGYFLDKKQQAGVTLTFGPSNHPMRTGMERILGPGAKASAIRIFQSASVAAQARAYFAS